MIEQFDEFNQCLRMIVVFFIILFAYLYVKNWSILDKKFLHLARKMELPKDIKCYPLIGHAHHFKNQQEIITVAKSFNTQCGVTRIGSRVYFFLNDADLIQACLTNEKCLNKPIYMDHFQYAKDGLFLTRGKTWKLHRKLINPTFNQHVLNFYASTFQRHDEELMRQFGNHAHADEVLDIIHLAKRYNFYKFFDCALGLNAATKHEAFFQALESANHGAMRRILSLFTDSELLLRFQSDYREYMQALEVMQQISTEILNDKRRMRTTDDGEADIEELIFINCLLKCNEREQVLTDEEIIGEITTFIAAGVDTCSTTFSFLCLALALHPDIQEEAYREVKEVLGGHHFHQSDGAKLPFLRNVIKETLRMFPIGPTLPRTTTSEVTLGDYNFPKDSLLQINVINVHYSEAYYNEPLVFRPERFNQQLPEAQQRHRYAYLPFAAGKRSCIGEKFADMSLMATAATMLQTFRIETTYKSLAEIRLEQTLTLNAVDGYPVRLHRRNMQ